MGIYRRAVRARRRSCGIRVTQEDPQAEDRIDWDHERGRLRPHSSPEEVLAMMRKKGNFRHMPVVNQGKLVGAVSIGGIRQHPVRETKLDHNALEILLGDDAY